VTLNKVKDLLVEAGREAAKKRDLSTGGDVYDSLRKIRARLRVEIEEAHAGFHNPGNVDTYMVIFDQLCDGVSPVFIAKNLKISRARMTQLMRKLRNYPAMQILKARLMGNPHGE